MVILMCFLYGASDKVTFALCIDQFDFTLLKGFNLRSIIKPQNTKIHVKLYHFDSTLTSNLDS